MAVRLIRKSWYIDIRFDFQRHRIKSPENSKAGAQAYEAVLRRKLAQGGSIGRTETELDSTFEHFADVWFKQYVVANNKYSEQYAKRKVLDASLIPHFGKMPIKSIHSGHIEQFKAKLVASGITNKTINNRLTVLSKSLRCAHEWYGMPMPIIRLLKCPPAKTDYLTTAECGLLISHSEGQLQEMLLLALRTGMRQGEVRGLQWSSIDWQNRSIVVRHSRCDRNRSLVSPKSNRERHIPIDIDAYEMLFRHKKDTGYVFTNPNRNNEPFTCARFIEDLGMLCEKAQIRKIGWHTLRHTFATQLTLRGVPLTVVKELLGHSAITTTMRYAHVAPSALRSAIEMLNPRNAQMENFGHQMGNGESFASKISLQI